MGELWRDLVELLRTRPILWLPVLLADLLGYLLNLARNGVLRQVVLHQTTQHSALGGAVVHGPMSASAMESTTIVALLLSWLTYFGRMLLYSGALIATAALVQSLREREPKPVQVVGPALARGWGGMLELALRGLAVYAVAALLFSWLSPFLAKHGQAALLHNLWFGYGLTLAVLLLLAVLLPPVALRVLSGQQPSGTLARASQQFSVVPVVVASLLAATVSANSRELALAPPGARYPLEIVGSLVVALPYVLLFTGLSLLARRAAQESPQEHSVS